MNIARLKHLITVLEAVPAEQFDLEDWKAEHDCGTTACAIGWAGMDAKFNAEGLKLGPQEDSWQPEYRGCRGFAAAMAFFGLKYDEANHLFHPDAYPYFPRPTAVDVINRIKTLTGTKA